MNQRPAAFVGLTPMQREAYAFVHRCISAGTAPSYDEIQRHLGLASKSGVHRLIQLLEGRGYIVRLRNRPRSLSLAPGAPVPIPLKDVEGNDAGHAFAQQATFSSPLVGDLMLIARRQDRAIADVVADAIRQYIERCGHAG